MGKVLSGPDLFLSLDAQNRPPVSSKTGVVQIIPELTTVFICSVIRYVVGATCLSDCMTTSSDMVVSIFED